MLHGRHPMQQRKPHQTGRARVTHYYVQKLVEVYTLILEVLIDIFQKKRRQTLLKHC